MIRSLLTLALTILATRGYRSAAGLLERAPGAVYRRFAAALPAAQQELKRAEFKGNIVVVDNDNVERYGESLAELLGTNCVGFDLEYVPDYYGSARRAPTDRMRPSVVQIASTDVCLVYLLYKIGYLPQSVADLVRSDQVLKVSHGAPSDMRLIDKHFGVKANNFVDLQAVSEEMKLRPCSLKGVVERTLGLQLSKKHQCSNWEAQKLSPEQIQYAATDAWVTLQAFLRIKPKKIQKLMVNDAGDVQVDERN